jgi:MoaA/NifB/PqqE/SkfB family radical SAM enzyme
MSSDMCGMNNKKRQGKKRRRVHIMTSGSCNNNCVFCCDRDPGIKIRGRNRLRYGTDHLPLSGFLKESAKPGDIDSIMFTGSEPTLNPELPLFVQYAKKAGYRSIALQTNGRRLCYFDFCQVLIKKGLTEVDVSLHGSKKEIHDALTRSSGAFAQTYKGLTNLCLLKGTHSFNLNVTFTVTRLNAGDIYDFIKMVSSLGSVDRLIFNTLMCTGNAYRYLSQLFIAYSDIAHTARQALRRFRKSSSYRKDMTIQLGPLPLCLASGIIDSISFSEDIVQLRDKKLREIQRGQKFSKRDECKPCIYYTCCEGIDSVYEQRKGWQEFIPVRRGETAQA